MKRSGRRLPAIAALLGGAACSGGQAPQLASSSPAPTAPVSASAPVLVGAPDEPAAPSASAAAGPAVNPLGVLAPCFVMHESAATRELFTWTTDDQVEALKKNPTLLTRSESPDHGVSFFDAAMDGRAQAGDKVAKLVRTLAFAKARFAWPHAWPTVLGFAGESYGERLIRVLLKRESLIAIVRDGSPGSRIVDVDGADRSEEDLLRHPELLAAVYFVHDAPTATFGAPGQRRLHYREFVLVNESRIELYETGTPAVFTELDRGIAVAEAMFRWAESKGQVPMDLDAFDSAASQLVWPGHAAEQRAPLNAYIASLAFPNELYLPNAANLRGLVSKLSSVPRTAPAFSHAPTVPFPGAKALVPIPKPVAKPRKWRGTFGTF